jgi:chromosome segregation ATPase
VAEVVPLGIGLTETPAAEVKGVATEEDKKEELPDDRQNNSSQQETNNVNISEKTMKKTIENIKDINDESLNEVSASTITDFIKSELERAADQYQEEMTEKEEALKTATEKSETLQAEHDQLTNELSKVKDALGELEKANAEREAEEKFNQRMSVLDEEYVLTDEDREVIASDIKDMDEEAFTTYQNKLSVLLDSKSKAAIAKAEAEAEEAKAEEVKTEPQEAVASEVSQETEAAVKEVVEEVLENAETEQDEVPVSSEAAEPTIYDKYAKAFGLDQFEIKVK